jgi:branched-chain amino acid transport system permease protein
MNKPSFNWLEPVKVGVIGGLVAILVSLMGMVEAFNQRDIIGGVITMGQTMLLITFVLFAGMAVRRMAQAHLDQAPPALHVLLSGALVGLVTAALLVVLLLIGPLINIRAMFNNFTPALRAILTLQMSGVAGMVLPLVVGTVLGALTAGLTLLSARIRQPITLGLIVIMFTGLLQELLRVMLDGWGALGKQFTWMFASRGLSVLGAIVVFAVVAGGNFLWGVQKGQVNKRVSALPPASQRSLRWGSLALLVLVMIVLPRVLGPYPSEVMVMTGLYALMGLGLNIVVGFAGLLDLGYVAFFAIGAYIMGILSSPEIGWIGLNLTFWEALVFCVGGALLAGILLGVPVLGMRGDYLAIVTLGFGEIIRLVALSDWLKPYIGGSNGITRIPKPWVGPWELADSQTLYYVVLAGCLLVAFVSMRLKDSRMGRTWMAMREDEDVAEAMGIHLISTKLLAFATGAAFSGLAGAIFASKLTSIYPHSFQLMVSINVLCVVIVGGMGSVPGAVVGALILVGAPELLREFAEYRYWFYGLLLVIMMLVKPEGFVPEATRRRELREEAVAEAGPAVAGAPAGR